MNEHDELVEQALSAWRPRDRDGGVRSHPAWHDLDEAGRQQVYEESLRLRRHFSLSDRVRYFWPVPEVQEAVQRLFANLDVERLPRGLVSQYLPDAVGAAEAGPTDGRAARLARLHVRRVLARYARACGTVAAGVAAGARLPL